MELLPLQRLSIELLNAPLRAHQYDNSATYPGQEQITPSKRSKCAGAIDIDGRAAIIATRITAFNCRPIVKPFRVSYREVHATMALAEAKRLMPIGAVQRDIVIKIHGIGDVLQIVVVGFPFTAAHHSHGKSQVNVKETFSRRPHGHARGNKRSVNRNVALVGG